MTKEVEKNERQMPKGARKGGARYPRNTLDDALKYAKKLVAKTHTAPLSKDAVHAGIVGAKFGKGDVKISSLRQYGYLEGSADAITATALAKRTIAAPDDERTDLYRQAALLPGVFKALFDTYHGDTVTRGKLKQRAADLNVHPELTADCIDIYLSAMTTAKLVQVDGDKVVHVDPGQGGTLGALGRALESGASEAAEDEPLDEDAAGNSVRVNGPVSPNLGGRENESGARHREEAAPTPRAVFNVNVTLDSSLDIEKLQKQLELLKRFGAI